VIQAQLCSHARVAVCALVPAFSGLFVSALATAGTSPVFAQEALQPVRYVRAASSGARVYNLADVKAEKLAVEPAGTLLAVYSERAGWLEVEPPAGLEAWVFGQFVQVTDQPGTIEISGNAVAMRPQPNSSDKSYPLKQRLDKGERVRVLGRADASKPIEQDWFKIATPAGTRAYVQVSETAALAAGEDGAGLWTKGSKEARAALPVIALAPAANSASGAPASGGLAPASGAAAAGTAAEKNAAKPAAASNVEAFDKAEKMMTAAVASPAPDYKPVRAAYEKLLAENPDASYAPQARLRLEQISAREEILAIKADAQIAEGKRKEELEKAKQHLEEVSLGKDPLWGRFQARGWLEKDGERWVVRWSGQTVADVVCTSGRYDISNFAGCEIGVSGKVVRAAIPASATATGQPAPSKIDAAKIEVISGRNTKK
jgi:hypothetical protein